MLKQNEDISVNNGRGGEGKVNKCSVCSQNM